MNPVRLIEKKRDGGTHTEAEIHSLIQCAITGQGMSPEQWGAWLMAVVWHGMSAEETAWLTREMADSGERIILDGIPHPWVDKHSTGGVGDKTTLILLPMLAACGLHVVKLSGRGLGITGGTLDKLSAVPGFRTQLSPSELRNQSKAIGLALGGQTANLAPADRFLYAMRDVTGTVPSIPLIASSILAKKVAGGAEVVAIDLKCGSGAFMHTLGHARALSDVLIETGEVLGLKVGVTITDMDQPLGQCAGNALEVIEAIETLQGKGRQRVRELCVELCASTLALSGTEPDIETARKRANHVLHTGEALEKARLWFDAQEAIVSPDHIHRLIEAPVRKQVYGDRPGWIQRVDARTVGEVVVDLGGGRRQKTDPIDPRVGVETVVEVGDDVDKGRVLFEIHAATEEAAEAAAEKLFDAVTIVSEPVQPHPVILEHRTRA